MKFIYLLLILILLNFTQCTKFQSSSLVLENKYIIEIYSNISFTSKDYLNFEQKGKELKFSNGFILQIYVDKGQMFNDPFNKLRINQSEKEKMNYYSYFYDSLIVIQDTIYMQNQKVLEKREFYGWHNFKKKSLYTLEYGETKENRNINFILTKETSSLNFEENKFKSNLISKIKIKYLPEYRK